jgi:3-hydroxyacyl-CoA dehydrogenase
VPLSCDATVAVVGLRAMGAGIAEVFARSGQPVVGVETDAAAQTRMTVEN